MLMAIAQNLANQDFLCQFLYLCHILVGCVSVVFCSSAKTDVKFVRLL